MKISVVTATYNHEKSLPKLYASLLKQKEYVHELIICDDGSTDTTWQTILSIAKQAPFTVRARAQENKGMRLAKSLNNGFRIATGDLLFVVMGDSYLQDDTLKNLSESYIPGSAGCGMRENVDEDGTFISHDWRVRDGNSTIVNVSTHPEAYSLLTGNSMIVARKDLKAIGWWDEGFEGYGRDDWSVFLHLQRNQVPLYQYNNVKINHIHHGEGQPDNRKNINRFERQLRWEI